MLRRRPRARLERAWQAGLPPPWDTVLAGAALVYRGGLLLRRAAYATGVRRTRRLPCRVVSVGNLTLGGTGKTPLVELIARELAARGRRVVVLSRGYRRRSRAPVEVVSDGERLLVSVAWAGDEPYLLARRLPGVPVVVGRDRHRAGELALARFAPDVLLLDDGFQQRRLATDVDVVVLDARAPWGRRGLFPRGTLREPPAALARAHLLVLTHVGGAADPAWAEREVRRRAPTAPIAHADYEAEVLEDVGSGARLPLDALRGRPCLAFAGIGAPDRFVTTLAELRVAPRDFVAFPDHHVYTRADLGGLETRAHRLGADLMLTTEKDAVRLSGRGTLPLWALHVRLRLRGDPAAWWAALEAQMDAAVAST
jgi:tetraacyldisaccharide 4'-kinase